MAHRKIGKRRSKTSNLIGQRMCIVSRKSMHHSELLRFVRADNGRVIFDTNNSASGRGAYICPDAKYIKLAAEKKILSKSFWHSSTC